jgi:hypothetical protein
VYHFKPAFDRAQSNEHRVLAGLTYVTLPMGCTRDETPAETKDDYTREQAFGRSHLTSRGITVLATILLDTFTKAEAEMIGSALDMICSPHDNYAFSSAGIYAFWSIPDRELLYIGLAKDLTQRFRQHLGLIACDPNCCKVQQINNYFSDRNRIGYSIIVQSTMCSPLTAHDEQIIRNALDDDAAVIDVSDIFEAEENIAAAEGMLIELFEQLGDRLPSWNKIRGSERGQRRHSFYSRSNNLRILQGLVEGKSTESLDDEFAAEAPPYELLLNLEGSELSELNARATLTEIANNATFCEHELLLHGIRMLMVSTRLSFEYAVAHQLAFNEFAKGRIDHMKVDGYWDRRLTLTAF